jgi:hypothetical protein
VTQVRIFQSKINNKKETNNTIHPKKGANQNELTQEI